MPAFETIPAEDNSLLDKPKASLRRVIVCAAALSFVLGAVAATAVDSSSNSSTAGAMDLHTTKISDAHISLVSSNPSVGKKCITATESSDLVLADCGTGTGKGHHSKQRFNYQYKNGKGQIELRDHQASDGAYVGTQGSLNAAMCGGGGAPCNAFLHRPDAGNPYKPEHVQWDTSTKQIKVIDSNGKDLCLTVASTHKLFWYTCDNSDLEKWQIGDAPRLPTPAPSPGGDKCGDTCLRDSDCGGDCTRCIFYRTTAHGNCFEG